MYANEQCDCRISEA